MHMTLGEEVQAWDVGRETPEPSSVLGASSEIPLQAQHMPFVCTCSRPYPTSLPSKMLPPSVSHVNHYTCPHTVKHPPSEQRYNDACETDLSAPIFHPSQADSRPFGEG